MSDKLILSARKTNI